MWFRHICFAAKIPAAVVIITTAVSSDGGGSRARNVKQHQDGGRVVKQSHPTHCSLYCVPTPPPQMIGTLSGIRAAARHGRRHDLSEKMKKKPHALVKSI